MELVSANTKNYLFLTLTQNNEVDEMVRARVSMRRDQAFWEGGNSFIACESFRITSAPNEGGLYYQVVPSDFVMSAVTDVGKLPDPLTAQFVAQANATPPPGLSSLGTVRLGDKLAAINIHVGKNPAAGAADTLQADLVVRKADNTAFHETAYQDLVPRVARYFGSTRISKNSVIALQDANGNGARTVQVKLTDNPLMRFTGPGLGNNGLFVPIVSFPVDADFAKIAASPTHDYMGSATLRFHAAYGGSVSSYTMDQVRALLGQVAYITPSGGPPIAPGAPGYPGWYHDPVYTAGPVFDILAPTGLTVDIPGSRDAHGQWVNPVHWDRNSKLAVGDAVWMKVGNNVMHGKVITPPSSPINVKPGYFDWLCDVRVEQNAITNFNLTLAIMENNRWCASNSSDPLGDAGYKCHVVGEVISANSDIDPTSLSVGLADLQHAATQEIIRGYEQRMVYTPNELYNMFNQSGPLTPPWLLQTDENGGFCVKWKQSADSKSTGSNESFYISKSMCDSLGLNPYMDYEQAQNTNDVTHTATLLNPTYRYLVEDDRYDLSSFMVDAPSTEVTVGNGAQLIPVVIPAQVNPVVPQINPNWYMMDTVVYGGRDYYILSVQEQEYKRSESSMQRKVPHLVDYKGIPCYLYTHLPEVGQIKNTGEVSVESWGTFSMINLVIPNIPFQSMLGGESDARILASLRLPFDYGTANGPDGAVKTTEFSYYGDLLYNSDSSRSYLRITTDQQLFDCDVEARLIRRDGSMEIMQIPYKGQFQVKLRLLQTQ